MGRGLRIIQMPLTVIEERGLQKFTNPLLSHWGLLVIFSGDLVFLKVSTLTWITFQVGDNDILLEIFPKGGVKPFHSYNTLRFTHKPDLAVRKAQFKFGIFPQGETDLPKESLFKLNPQKFVPGQDGVPEVLEEVSVIIDQAEPVAAYELAGINPPGDFDDLTEDEKAKLATAEKLVGTEA